VRSSPVDPALARVGEVAIGPGLRAVAIDAALACVASGGFQVFDLASLLAPSQPAARGRVDCPAAEDIFLAGGYAYIAAGDTGLVIVNLADPGAPRVESTLPLSGFVRRVHVVGDLAYLVSYEQGLQIVNVRDRRNPALLSQIFVELPNSVVVRDQVAYVASDDSGYCFIDVAVPSAPAYHVRYASNFETGKDICLHGQMAYVFAAPDQIKVIDVAQPAAPREVGEVAAEPGCYAARMIVSGDALLVASSLGEHGLYVYDISAPGSPRYTAAAGYPAQGLAAGERYVYLATEAGALEVLDLRPPRLALPAGGLGIGVATPKARLEVRGGLSVLEQEPWQSAELAEGYRQFDGEYNPVQYFRDSLGIVHLRGTLGPNALVGTLEAGVLFTLAPGYRPEFIENHLASAGTVIGRLEVFPDGKVLLTSDGHTWVSLDGITFRAFA
jgi:hypothetical protein